MQAKTQKTKTEEIQTTFQTKEIEAFQIINSSIKLGEQASWSVGKRCAQRLTAIKGIARRGWKPLPHLRSQPILQAPVALAQP